MYFTAFTPLKCQNSVDDFKENFWDESYLETLPFAIYFGCFVFLLLLIYTMTYVYY